MDLIVRGKRVKPPEERFWSKVDKNGPVPIHCPELGQCWLWTGSKTVSGNYGQINVSGRPVRANRFSWVLHNGPIPEGLYVLHYCDNPPCVRPNHLFLGSHDDNLLDMKNKGRAGAPHSKLTATQIEEIKSMYPALSQYKIADRFSVDQSAVSRLINNLSYKEGRYVKN